MADQTIVGWGENQYGQLGTGNGNPVTKATVLSLPSGVKARTLAESDKESNGRALGFISTNNELYIAGTQTASGSPQRLFFSSTVSNDQIQGFTKVMDNVLYANIFAYGVAAQLSDLSIKVWGGNSSYHLNTGNQTNYYADQAITLDLGTDNGQSSGTVSTTSNTEIFNKSIETTGKNLDIGGGLTVADSLTIDGILIKDNKVKIGDSTNNTTLSAASSGGALNLKFPSSLGTTGQYLKTDGSGNTSWNTIDSINEGDSSVEVTDSGSNGEIKLKADGDDVMKVQSNLITIYGSIIPSVDALFDIGSGNKRIRDIYVSQR